jgi:hypothetical protein
MKHGIRKCGKSWIMQEKTIDYQMQSSYAELRVLS